MILLTRGVRMTIVFKVSDNIKEEMIKYYQDKKIIPFGEYEKIIGKLNEILFESEQYKRKND